MTGLISINRVCLLLVAGVLLFAPSPAKAADFKIGDPVIGVHSLIAGEIIEIRANGDIRWRDSTGKVHLNDANDLKSYRTVRSLNGVRVGQLVVFSRRSTDYDYGTVLEIRENGEIQWEDKDGEIRTLLIDDIEWESPQERADRIKYPVFRSLYFSRKSFTVQSEFSARLYEKMMNDAIKLARQSPSFRKLLIQIALGRDPGRHWRLSGTNRRLRNRAQRILVKIYDGDSGSAAPAEEGVHLRVEASPSGYREARYQVIEEDPAVIRELGLLDLEQLRCQLALEEEL